MTQTFWLSFCDDERPKGQRFLGVAIIDVTEDDAAAVAPAVTAKRAAHGGGPDEDANWIAAAIVKAHRTGCNPGGAVASARIDLHPNFPKYSPRYPRNQLLSRADVEALEPEE